MVLDSVTIKTKYDAGEMGYDECVERLSRIGYNARQADDILVPVKPKGKPRANRAKA